MTSQLVRDHPRALPDRSRVHRPVPGYGEADADGLADAEALAEGLAEADAPADGLAPADADALGDEDALAEADALAEGMGVGLGVARPVSRPPSPSRIPLRKIATNTTTVPITKTFEAVSLTWTASSDGVGARAGVGWAAPRRRDLDGATATVASRSS